MYKRVVTLAAALLVTIVMVGVALAPTVYLPGGVTIFSAITFDTSGSHAFTRTNEGRLVLVKDPNNPSPTEIAEYVPSTGVLTLKTPTINSPVLSGTVTGIYTLAGTPSLNAALGFGASGSLTAPVLSGTATGTYTLGGTVSLPTITGNTTWSTGNPVLPSSTLAGLPPAGTAGLMARVTDSLGGIHLANGTSFQPIYPVINAAEMAGADAGAKIIAAEARLPASGGVIDARGLTGAQTISATVALTKPLQLILGASTFTASVVPAFTYVDDVYIVGLGPTATKIVANLTGSILRSPDTAVRRHRVTVRDLLLDNTSRTNAGGIGLNFTNINSGYISNVIVQNVATGVLLNGTGGGAFYNDFYSVKALTTTNGIILSQLANENRFFGGKVGDSTIGIDVDNNTNNTFYSVSVETFTTGVRVGFTTATQYAKFIGLRLENTPTSGTGFSITSLAQATGIIGPMFAGLTTNISDNGADTFIFSDTNVKMSGTANIQRLSNYRPIVDFPSIAANFANDQAVTIAGAITTDHWVVTPDATIPGGLMVVGIPSTGQMFIRMANVTTGAIDPPALSFYLTQIRYNNPTP